MLQSTALAILKSGANVFLTGKPGSGKTYTINRYREYLRAEGIAVAVTASTGIAATHIGGQTIHSWSGIGIHKILSTHDFQLMRERKSLLPRLLSTKVLIIDEVSMLDGATLDLVNQTLQELRENPLPFGGMQVILVGDFFQLPPVERNALFAFESEAWKQLQPIVCYLSEQHRQEDPHFLDMLDAIRTGQDLVRVERTLSVRILDYESEMVVTRLFSHNRDVDRVNTDWLGRLPGEPALYHMQAKGQPHAVASLIKGCLSPELLELKKGARVMFTKNSLEDGFVNGTLGEVVGFTTANEPLVKTTNGTIITVEPMEWAIEEDGKKIASISQLPMRLAWAITVHKSQGMTIDAAIIDLSQTFEYGQGYVAISRVRSLSGLHLLGLNTMALKVHPKIQEIDAVFLEHSKAADKRHHSQKQSK